MCEGSHTITVELASLSPAVRELYISMSAYCGLLKVQALCFLRFAVLGWKVAVRMVRALCAWPCGASSQTFLTSPPQETQRCIWHLESHSSLAPCHRLPCMQGVWASQAQPFYVLSAVA